MPVSTLNGWTSAGLLPSSTVVSQILGRSGAGPQAPTNPTATTPGAPVQPPIVLPPMPAPLPSVPARQPQNWGGGGVGFGDPSLLGGGGRGGWVNPSLTPEQAYSTYLQYRAAADNSTPLHSALQALTNTQSKLAYADPYGPNRNGLNMDPYGSTLRANLQAQILGAQRASPYAYSYGAPAANAPAPAPAWGYAPGYGMAPPGAGPTGYNTGASGNPGYGFGF